MPPDNLPDLDALFSGLALNVPTCPRCEGDHPGLTFQAFKVDGQAGTHWAMCPTNHEPVMMEIQLL